MARTRELIFEQIPDLGPYDQRLIDPKTKKTVFGDELGDALIAPILIESAGRKEIIGTLSVSRSSLKLSHSFRQSRILMTVDETTQEIKFKPLRPGGPEPAIVIDRRNLIEEGRELLSQTGHSLQNTLKQTTTVPLHGMKPLSATHRIFNSKVIHEITLVNLHPPITDFKRSILSNGTAGFGSPYEQKRCLPRRRTKRGY